MTDERVFTWVEAHRKLPIHHFYASSVAQAEAIPRSIVRESLSEMVKTGTLRIAGWEVDCPVCSETVDVRTPSGEAECQRCGEVWDYTEATTITQYAFPKP